MVHEGIFLCGCVKILQLKLDSTKFSAAQVLLQLAPTSTVHTDEESAAAGPGRPEGSCFIPPPKMREIIGEKTERIGKEEEKVDLQGRSAKNQAAPIVLERKSSSSLLFSVALRRCSGLGGGSNLNLLLLVALLVEDGDEQSKGDDAGAHEGREEGTPAVALDEDGDGDAGKGGAKVGDPAEESL